MEMARGSASSTLFRSFPGSLKWQPQKQVVTSVLYTTTLANRLFCTHVFQAEPWFNIKFLSYQCRKSHCGDTTIIRSSYLHNGNSYTGKMASFIESPHTFYGISILSLMLLIKANEYRVVAYWVGVIYKGKRIYMIVAYWIWCYLWWKMNIPLWHYN